VVIALGVLLVASVGSKGQNGGLTKESEPWTFQPYPVPDRLVGKPAKPVLVTDLDQGGCGTNSYEWRDKQLKLVHFEPWPKSSH
jgi:hypothetical protein